MSIDPRTLAATITLVLAAFGCGSTVRVHGDAITDADTTDEPTVDYHDVADVADTIDADTTVDDPAVECPEVADVIDVIGGDCPLPFVEGPCDLNINEFIPDRLLGTYTEGWWGPPGEWSVTGFLDDVPCGSSGSTLHLRSYGASTDPPEDPEVGPKEVGTYEIADWVSHDTCGLCIWYFEDGDLWESARLFRASTGTLVIDELLMLLPDGEDEHFRGTLINVVFEESDQETLQPIPCGASLCIERWDIDTVLEDPPL